MVEIRLALTDLLTSDLTHYAYRLRPASGSGTPLPAWQPTTRQLLLQGLAPAITPSKSGPKAVVGSQLGLHNMATRAKALNGTADTRSRRVGETGYQVRLRVKG